MASKRGRRSVDIFQAGDPVRIQDPHSKKLNIKGTIENIRYSDKGVQSSFQIKKRNGRATLRHKSHVRHDITVDDRVAPSKVSFQEEIQIKPIREVQMTRAPARELSMKVLNTKSSLREEESYSQQEEENHLSPQ